MLTACVEQMFIFFPTRYPMGHWQPQGLQFEDVWFETEDGVRLHAWYIPAAEDSEVLIFAHGNAGNLSDRLALVQTLHNDLGLSVLIFDYRGYGRSEGSPSVQGILKDAKAARKWLTARVQRKPEDIILMGRSLGASVAVHMAAESGARALILESAFSSFKDVADRVYPWLPARFLLRNDIQADVLIRDYHGPLFQSHGMADSMISINLGRKIYEAAHEPKEFIALPGLDHNDPPPPDYYDKLDSFIKNLAK